MSESYSVETFMLPTVVKTFCDEGAFPHNPLEIISLEEAVEAFKHESSQFLDGEIYTMTQEQFKKALDSVAAKAINKLLGAMVLKGKLEMMHDGTDFCFRKPKGAL